MYAVIVSREIDGSYGPEIIYGPFDNAAEAEAFIRDNPKLTRNFVCFGIDTIPMTPPSEVLK
jgi:hypothetical protein